MTTQPRRPRKRRAPDLRLKIAIIENQRTQRQVGLATRIAEVRLSKIIHGEDSPPTPTERARLAKYLNRREEDLFAPLAPDPVLTAIVPATDESSNPA